MNRCPPNTDPGFIHLLVIFFLKSSGIKCIRDHQREVAPKESRHFSRPDFLSPVSASIPDEYTYVGNQMEWKGMNLHEAQEKTFPPSIPAAPFR
jgi:hypothetical protein